MSRTLLLVNGALVAVAVVSAAAIVREVTRSRATPQAVSARPARPAPAEPTERAPVTAGAYTTVAARNLFSPTRSEAPAATGTAADAAPATARPYLHGVVLREGAPVAYLEDPSTKRVAGYRVGDAIVGGTVQTIAADSVVIARPDGRLDVRLRDPSKPRPAATAGAPGAAPRGAPEAAGGVPPTVVQPGQPGQPPQFVPGRRPLPPNLLRRLPPASIDATRQ